MRFQDYIIDATKRAAHEVFRNAEAVPADRVEWAPEGGRSILDMARELGMTPLWAFDLITGESTAEGIDSSVWTTVDDCRTACDKGIEALVALYATIPDEKLSETKFLPYEGGRDFTIVEIMEYPRWNFNYHLGQICYLQTLYGDKEMH